MILLYIEDLNAPSADGMREFIKSRANKKRKMNNLRKEETEEKNPEHA